MAQRLSALAKLPQVELEVCSPEPRFSPVVSPFISGKPLVDTYQNLKIYRPRYFYIPRYFKQFDATFYSKGLISWATNYCRENRPDILDAHFAWPDGVGVYHLARKLNLPYAITLRGWIWVGMKQPKLWRQAVEALRNAPVIINLCGAMADVCREIGCDEKRLHVINNGIDRSLFFPLDRAEARRELALPPDVPIIACVSFYQRRKGILELIEALHKLPREALLVLVGEPAETEYYKEMNALIGHLGLKDRVIMPGSQPHHRIALYMNAANVTALPSYWEGSPNAVVESLGCGTPVVATPVGSVPEQVLPGKNGYIVPMKNVEALADALKSTLSREWDRGFIAASVKSWHEVALDVESALRSGVR